DTDNDGQIGLYEWKASGRPIETFLAMDRNKDGFLTIDEIMRANPPKANAPANGGGQATANNNPNKGKAKPTGHDSTGGNRVRGNRRGGNRFGGNRFGGNNPPPGRGQ